MTTMHDWDGMANRAVALVRAAAPELTKVPVYLVPQSTTEFRGVTTLAFTGPRVDVWTRPTIGKSWRGRGVAVVVNEKELDDEPPEVRTDVLAALGVHEVAHALTDGWALVRKRGEPRLTRRDVLATIPAAAALYEEPPTDKIDDFEFDNHGIDWIRTALHMRARLERQGTYLPASRVIGRRPLLSLAETYAGALGDEPERMAGRPFADLLATPPPPAFASLWEEDRRGFIEQRDRNH